MNKRYILTWIAWIVTAFLVAVGCAQVTTPQAKTVTLTVSAAASLQDAIEALKPIYTQQNPDISINYNFGSSGALQQQIEQGAPVDVFISAAPKQMNSLEDKGLLLADTRKDLLTNQIVLVIPKEVTGISNFQDLTGNRVSKIALGNPDSVPAGQYGKEVFTSLKLLKPLESKLVFAKDVRQVLSYVETGNVEAGIVYATDAKTSDKVKVVATAPTNSHSPIIYPVAVLKASKNVDTAKGFVQFLSSKSAKTVFEKYGFRMANK